MQIGFGNKLSKAFTEPSPEIPMTQWQNSEACS